jgi:UDP-2,3-diacylglucosamine hydrolase
MQADKIFLGEDKEWLIIFAREVLAKEHFDYFIFGHRHFPLDHKLDHKSRYINLGDWIRDFTYAYFDGTDVYLKKWEE